MRAPDNAANDTLISEAQAAALLGVAQRTLQGWRRKGGGPPFIRLTGRSVRYRQADVLGWVMARLCQRNGCVGDFKRLWKTACVAAGVPAGRKRGGFVFHNTRHTAITNLVNEGTPAHEAMAISGHRTRSVFDRYSLPLKAQTRAALERVSGHTLGHTPGEIPAKIRGHRRAKSARS